MLYLIYQHCIHPPSDAPIRYVDEFPPSSSFISHSHIKPGILCNYTCLYIPLRSIKIQQVQLYPQTHPTQDSPQKRMATSSHPSGIYGPLAIAKGSTQRFEAAAKLQKGRQTANEGSGRVRAIAPCLGRDFCWVNGLWDTGPWDHGFL